MELLHVVGELHVPVLIVTIIGIALADHEGWKYYTGAVSVLDPKKISRLHRWVWFGLAGMIVTGSALIVSERADVLAETAFYVKMAMVGALIANGVLIGLVSPVAATTPYSALPPLRKRLLMFSGAVSVLCWLGAALIGVVFLG